MKTTHTGEIILIIFALFASSLLIGYNAFYIPKPVIYEGTDKNLAFININTATSDELQELEGIGPVIAKRIIAYREEHGNFKSTAAVKNVKGISDALYEKIRYLIVV